MTVLQRVATTASIVAELSHVFCCGLPILVAIVSAGTQVGLGGGFLAFHDVMHDYEVPILIGSGLLLLAGLALHYISYQLDCRANAECTHSDCAPKKFRVGRIFTLALCLYGANIAFFVLSGHGLH